MSIDPTAWCEEVGLHSNLFAMLAHHLPAPLKSTRDRLQARLDA